MQTPLLTPNLGNLGAVSLSAELLDGVTQEFSDVLY